MAFHSTKCMAQLANYCECWNCEIKWPCVKTGGAGRIKLHFYASRVHCILRKNFAEGGQQDFLCWFGFFSELSWFFVVVVVFFSDVHFNSYWELLNSRTESQTYWSGFRNEFISWWEFLVPHLFLFPSLALLE